MKELSIQTLEQAVQLCCENDYYSVLVVTQHIYDHPYILDFFAKHNLNDIKSNGGHHTVCFSNGSIIKIVGMSKNQCGVRSDLVLYDWRLANDKNVMTVLRCFEARNTSFKLSTKFKEDT